MSLAAIVGGRQDRPTEPLRVLKFAGQEVPDDAGHFRRAVPSQRRLHPAGGKEDVTGLLDLAQQPERRQDESPGVRFAKRMIEVLERLEHPRLPPPVLDEGEPRERFLADRRVRRQRTA